MLINRLFQWQLWNILEVLTHCLYSINVEDDSAHWIKVLGVFGTTDIKCETCDSLTFAGTDGALMDTTNKNIAVSHSDK